MASPPGQYELAPGVLAPRSILRFRASRSSGPGGQNVNKRSTKVELRVNVDDLPISKPARKRLVRLAGRRAIVLDPSPPVDDSTPQPDSSGAGDQPAPAQPPELHYEVLIVSDERRTQHLNKQACLDRLRELLIRALAPPKRRKKTRPTRGSKERRLQTKREHSQKKDRRRRPED